MSILAAEPPANAALPSDATDQGLVEEVRGGSTAAYGELYSRYHADALARARWTLPASHASLAEDVVEIVFGATYDAIRGGRGPRANVRAYLMAAVRRECWHQQNRRDREPLIGATTIDLLDAGSPEARPGRQRAWRVAEHAAAGDARTDLPIDSDSLFGAAFNRLNGRFRRVLWLTEVEGLSTSEVAERLDLSPNSAAALTYRARRALSSAYFAGYQESVAASDCEAFVAPLASFVRAGQPDLDHHEVRRHLGGCADCRDVARGSARHRPSLPATAAVS